MILACWTNVCCFFLEKFKRTSLWFNVAERKRPTHSALLWLSKIDDKGYRCTVTANSLTWMRERTKKKHTVATVKTQMDIWSFPISRGRWCFQITNGYICFFFLIKTNIDPLYCQIMSTLNSYANDRNNVGQHYTQFFASVSI